MMARSQYNIKSVTPDEALEYAQHRLPDAVVRLRSQWVDFRLPTQTAAKLNLPVGQHIYDLEAICIHTNRCFYVPLPDKMPCSPKEMADRIAVLERSLER